MSRELKTHPTGFKWVQIGPCRLILGDCLEVLPLLKSAAGDLGCILEHIVYAAYAAGAITGADADRLGYPV